MQASFDESKVQENKKMEDIKEQMRGIIKEMRARQVAKLR